MSNSFKKRPFIAICGSGSAKQDKLIAHRAERRAVTGVLHQAVKFAEFDEVIVPLRRECAHNDVWGWSRDGNQRYCGLDARNWEKYVAATSQPWSWWYGDEHYSQWPPKWYQDMMRK